MSANHSFYIFNTFVPIAYLFSFFKRDVINVTKDHETPRKSKETSHEVPTNGDQVLQRRERKGLPINTCT